MQNIQYANAIRLLIALSACSMCASKPEHKHKPVAKDPKHQAAPHPEKASHPSKQEASDFRARTMRIVKEELGDKAPLFAQYRTGDHTLPSSEVLLQSIGRAMQQLIASAVEMSKTKSREAINELCKKAQDDFFDSIQYALMCVFFETGASFIFDPMSSLMGQYGGGMMPGADFLRCSDANRAKLHSALDSKDPHKIATARKAIEESAGDAKEIQEVLESIIVKVVSAHLEEHKLTKKLEAAGLPKDDWD